MIDFVYESPNNLTHEFCNEMVRKFESDPRRAPGRMLSGIDQNVKDSTDLMIGRYAEWSEYTKVLDAKLQDAIQAYQTFLNKDLQVPVQFSKFTHLNHYQLQKSGKFEFHHDFAIQNGLFRVITFMWYLNTPDEGGETDFVYKKVKPEPGKLVLFPATWNLFHKGTEAKNKYIVTGWLWQTIV